MELFRKVAFVKAAALPDKTGPRLGFVFILSFYDNYILVPERLEFFVLVMSLFDNYILVHEISNSRRI
jgi:hypothetical protein